MKNFCSPAVAAVFSTLIFIIGCDSKTVFEEKKSIAGGQWVYADSLDFEFEIADTSEIYNLFLDFKHAENFPAQNVYLKLFTRFPDGKRLGKVLSIDLFDAKGQPVGESAGKKIRLHAPLQEGAFFPKPGKYGLTLHQFTRQDSLPGLVSVGFSIEKTGKKR